MTDFAAKLKISEKMADVIEYGVQDYKWVWLEGSAQCGKSVTAALAFALLIEDSKKGDDVFLALGYTQTSAINNVFECGGFGLIAYFAERCKMCKYKGPSGKLKTAIDALQIRTKTGIKYVVPFGTNTKTSNNVYHGWRIAGALIDEIDRACQESIDEVRQRITTVPDARIIVTQNPNLETHPVYQLLKELQDRDLVHYSHWVLDDNVGMSSAQIAQKKAEYDPNSLFYKRYVLGQRVSPNGQIYTIRDYNIIDDFNPDDYLEYIIVCDQGESISASVFILAALRYDKNKGYYAIDILKHYYYKNEGKSDLEVKMFADTADDLCQFYKESHKLMRKYPVAVLIDISPEFYRNCLLSFRKNNISQSLLKYVQKEDIEQRIKTGLNLLYKAQLRFYKECKEIIQDFRNAEYDNDKIEKKGIFERNKIYTSLGHLDGIDAVEYANTYYKKKLYIG